MSSFSQEASGSVMDWGVFEKVQNEILEYFVPQYKLKWFINLFHANFPFLYLLKMLENL